MAIANRAADSVSIVVDDRETGSSVLQALRGLEGVKVTVRRLPLGDYLVDDRILFERKTLLMRILDVSARAEGVQIFIGGESGVSAPDEVSVVTSPYKVGGEVVGTVGVIGPTRMAYDRVVPIVDVTAKLLSSALSQP